MRSPGGHWPRAFAWQRPGLDCLDKKSAFDLEE
jgi:hypothetical protein